MKRKSNKNIKTRTSKKKKTFSFSYKNTSTIFSLISIIFLIVLYKLIGLMFTILLVSGILLILLGSKLINNLRKKKTSRKIVNTLIITFLCLGIIGIVIVGLFCLYIIKNAPNFDPSKLVYSESTIIYDSKGEVITELGTEKREIIEYDEISEVLIDAIIATEDSRFFQHNGVDAARFLKASIGQVFGQSNAGGASTLSMQVIKNSFTSKEASGIAGIIRKFTDIYLSVFKLEKNYSKQEILEFYVNNHFLGNNSYGVEQASKTYFGKKASELNLAEAALMVGLFKAPTKYNPYINPENATSRRETVLKLMYRHGYITEKEKDLANSIPVESLLANQTNKTTQYQSYIDTVVEEIDNKYNVNPYNTPMLIYTNMDRSKQKDIDDIFNGKTFTWENDYIQAGLAAVDINNGKLIAIGGGRNKNSANSYNFATMINRQIGSTSKPIIDYSPGMEYLNWSTYTIFDDSPYQYSDGKQIRNSDRGYMGNITIKTALAQSRNIPALKAFQLVMKELGEKEYKEFVRNFGITTESYLHEAHSIGAFNGSNPLKMAAAYAVFANGGTYYEPYSVNKIIYRDTGEVVEYESEGKKIISDSTAYMITNCLESAVQGGLSSDARLYGYNIAAKTGTTNYDEETVAKYQLPYDAVPDSWMVAYDPDISIGLWYGCEKADKNKYLPVINSVVNKGKLFRAVAQKILTPGKQFDIPSSVIKVGIEKGSNPAKLASSNTPSDQITYEYFKVGTEPTETSIKYSTLKNISNLIAEYNVSDLSLTLNCEGVDNTITMDTSTYGDFGYKIYKDNTYIGFTADTTYTILDVNEPDATYKVITSFKNYSDNASSGVSYKYVSELSLEAKLKYNTSNYTLGDTLAIYDATPSSNDVIVHYNSELVTPSTNIIIVIKDSKGNEVKEISSDKTETYTITYNISYKSNTKTLSRKIIIG